MGRSHRVARAAGLRCGKTGAPPIDCKRAPGLGAATEAAQRNTANGEEKIMRTITRRVGFAVLLVLAVSVGFARTRAAGAEESEAPAKLTYATEKMGDCLDCHDEDAKYPVLPILATQHGVKADGRTPLSKQYECQTCHGPSAAHIEDSDVRPPILFGADYPAGPQNEVCLGCHQGGARINWQGSVHATSDVACASCHSIHVKQDPVMVKDRRPDTPVMRRNQTAVCFKCHPDKQAEIHKYSSHPLRDGDMVCSDCHNPHGSMGPANLIKPTVNETCYTCHAEKRGPFLWEHAPVAEDCDNCHTPHGSNHPNMLRMRLPQLCQSCHVPGGHPSTAYAGPNYTVGAPQVIDRRVGSKSCVNCHVEIHGSNHPSGVRFTR
jgi:DmsE family decaheme c-type cytochrome